MSETSGNLKGVKVAILSTDGFEQAELLEPKKALEAAGAIVHVIAPKSGAIQGFKHVEKGSSVTVDRTFEQAQPDDYDGVVLPGGVVNGDALRMVDKARGFIETINAAQKPIAVICHGTWLLVSTGIVKDRTVTSWPSLQDDIRNAGGKWVDKQVVHDANLISSRKPDDLPAFNGTLIDALAKAHAHH
ncbi:MAG TPA: type 1 glutamine amidotransferase domain-containing protein [Pararobbsia sp.]|nr:type 1 glutamine amidotransferase domain-containing protein [Pararobbsia sp.]